jgi:hypothetical protein
VSVGSDQTLLTDLYLPLYHFLHLELGIPPPQENYCLHRYKGLSEWVGMLDADELFSPTQPTYSTLADVLRAQSSNTTAIRIANRFWVSRIHCIVSVVSIVSVANYAYVVVSVVVVFDFSHPLTQSRSHTAWLAMCYDLLPSLVHFNPICLYIQGPQR